MSYKGWDCHAYTEDCKKWWTNFDKKENLSEPMIENDINNLIENIVKLPIVNPTSLQAIEKMKKRCTIERGGYEDGQLHGLNVIRLLERVWLQVENLKDESINSLFIETLADISLTCPEGDSHRLIMLLNALLV